MKYHIRNVTIIERNLHTDLRILHADSGLCSTPVSSDVGYLEVGKPLSKNQISRLKEWGYEIYKKI